jgi:SAM-dependent methyltransferase
MHRDGVLEKLREKASVDLVCQELGLDRQVVLSALRYVAHESGLVEEVELETFIVVATPVELQAISGLTEKYIGAFGSLVLVSSLRSPDRVFAKTHVSNDAFVKVFASQKSNDPLATLMHRDGMKCVLDLGCGCGQTLFDYVAHGSDNFGFGVDINAGMIAEALRRAKDYQDVDRLKFAVSDSFEFKRVFGQSAVDTIDAVCAASWLNEYFQRGDEGAIRSLKKIKSLLPGRRLYLLDYYSSLGVPESETRTATGLHDIVQVLTGQGLPPACLEEWCKLYSASEMEVVEVFHGESLGIRWFIHVLQM